MLGVALFRMQASVCSASVRTTGNSWCGLRLLCSEFFRAKGGGGRDFDIKGSGASELLHAMMFRWFLAVVFAAACAGARAVEFRTDVMAVLSKAGCNSGACHGNGQGKGAFKLSLRGQDPADDWAALAREQGGRRVNVFEPAESLVFLKATGAMPHEGGRRFGADSVEGRILMQWLRAGASDSPDAAAPSELEVTPENEVVIEPRRTTRIRATAVFPDGTRRDVSRLAVYEPSDTMVKVDIEGGVEAAGPGEVTVVVRYLGRQKPVRLAFIPPREDFRWNGPEPAGFVDEHIFAKLRSLRMNPAPLCDDATFVRRVYLDLLGVIPSDATARAFTADVNPDKRALLVEALLQRREFADFWALKWADLLRIEERQLDAKGVSVFHAWIRASIAANKPMDVFARELVAARGSTYENPPANWWRANRDPVSRGENTARVFLGTQINCAQCHNHPFERWTQADYYDWTSVFRRVDYKIVKNDRKDTNDQKEFRGEQIVNMSGKARVVNPRTGEAAAMRFLGGGPVPEGKDELDALGDWLSRSPQFARMQANRVWANLLGRGLVDPPDDFRASNPPSHPELLDALGREFASNGFDLRRLVRTIVLSKTYQLGTGAGDEFNASRAVVKRLGAEQILDSTAKALGVKLEIPGHPELERVAQVPEGRKHYRPLDSEWDFFQLAFGKPPRLVATDCERLGEPTVVQAFQLISGAVMRDLLTRSPRVTAWSTMEPAAAVEAMVWTILGRGPTELELQAFSKHLAKGDRRKAAEDAAWALLNSKEFLFRR